MIYNTLGNSALYECVHPGFKAAFAFIREAATDIPDGKYVIDGDNVIAHVMTKETKTRDEISPEYHRKYIDVQFILDGEEGCDLSANVERKHTVPYDAEKDIAFLAEDPETAKLRVAKGYLYIVWPHEPHKPLCSIGKAARQVRKIVVKVAVKESLIKHF